MNDKVRMEETGDTEGGVDPDDAEDHDKVDLGNDLVLCGAIVTK